MPENEIVREFRVRVPEGATPEQVERLKVQAAVREAEKIRDELVDDAIRKLFKSFD